MFAATHDLELPKMLSDDVEAYYFTEEIIDNEVVFPYVLHKGTTDRTNAIRLLSALGFDHSVTDTSNRLAEEYRKSGKWEMTS
jgi:DNA mismatch repair ATPase MutS